MTYNPKVEKWYCIECYEALPGYMKPNWNLEYPEGIKKNFVGFLQLLAEASAGSKKIRAV